RCAGAARRMLSSGTRLWPPASTLPSWPTSASSDSASATVLGRWYSNTGGFIARIISQAGNGGSQERISFTTVPWVGDMRRDTMKAGRWRGGALLGLGLAVVLVAAGCGSDDDGSGGGGTGTTTAAPAVDEALAAKVPA